ncbi:DUF3330 domain-containing protein [Acidobacteriota bacterium]
MSNEHEHEMISCAVCQKMIPKAAAVHAEGSEYVAHYCSSDCMVSHKEDSEKKDDQK